MAVKTKTATEKLATKEATTTSTQSDVIKAVASEVETLNEKNAFQRAKELVEGGGLNEFRLGGVLAVIQSNGWLGDYESFDELCEGEFRIAYRKANYLINNYKALTEKQIPWDVVKNMGWSKLREVSKILTPKNAAAWAKKAEKMTVVQIIDAVKKQNAKGQGSDAEETEGSELTTITFKVHPDQKEVIKAGLEKAKKETSTEFDSVALTNIMTGYSGGSVSAETEANGDDTFTLVTGTGKKADAERVAQMVKLFEAYCGAPDDVNDVMKVALDKAFPKITFGVEFPEAEEATA